MGNWGTADDDRAGSAIEDGSTDSGSIADWIDKAAREVVRRMTYLNGGAQPLRMRDWLRCCERLGITAVPVTHIPAFTATISGYTNGHWEILYNGAARPAQQARFLAHELTEYITREQTWSTPPPPCDVNGHFVRHEIACRVEALCFS